ncbi:MAG TPA: DciA family protein [Alphaproteobacteria bacterium]|nr:DciA family protein [Alphaproteobacteria bacterium]
MTDTPKTPGDKTPAKNKAPKAKAAVPKTPASNVVIERRGIRSLAATLPPITAPIFKTRGFAEAGILTDWPAIVGEMLGRRTAPERIAFARSSKRDGTLHVVCESAFAPELQHLAPQVIERINGYFGYPAVAQLKILHGQVPQTARKRAAPRKPPDSAPYVDASIKDDDLRASLARLGAAIGAKGGAARKG